MKIAHVVPTLEPGGVETFVLNSARFFQKQGHAVEVVATERRGAWFDRCAASGVPATCLELEDSYSSVVHAVRVGAWLRAQAFDVVLLNHSRHAQSIIGMLSDTCKVIPIVHNDDPEIYRVASANHHRWNVAICTSKRLAAVMAQRLPEHRLVVIEQGIEVPPPTGDRREASFDPMKLLYVGRLYDRQKGVLLLPDILHGAQEAGLNVSLTVAGTGPDRDRLLDRIARLDLEESCTLLDGRDRAQVLELLGSHHVLVMPSYYEGFGIIALEAQAYGCVPVASRLEGATEISISHGESGFLAQAQDPGEYVGYLKRLHEDQGLWNRLSDNGRRRITDRFSIDAMGEAYLRAIAEVPPFPSGRWRAQPHSVDNELFTWRDYLPNGLKAILRRAWRGEVLRSLASGKE